MLKPILVSLLAIMQVLHTMLIGPVFAGSLSSAKVTISDSRAGGSGISHTLNFTTGTTDTIETVLMQYCTTPSGSCTVPTGLVTTGASQGSITGLGASTTNFTSNGTIILTVASPAIVNTGTAVTIAYTGITNPSTADTTFFVRVTTKNDSSVTVDSTVVAFAILTSGSMAVSADVGSTLSVSIAAVTAGSVNGQNINVTDTTAASIPFGSMYAGAAKVAAHDITVATNANHGYSVTIKSDDPPLSAASNNLDKFTGINASPTVWTTPAGSSANVNTGFVGYTTEDSSLCTGTADRFTSEVGNKWAGPDAVPSEVICTTGSVLLGETVRVGWQAEVNPLQPPGSYLGTFVLVTTPTY